MNIIEASAALGVSEHDDFRGAAGEDAGDVRFLAGVRI